MSEITTDELHYLRQAARDLHPYPRVPRSLLLKIVEFIDSHTVAQCQGTEYATGNRCPRVTLPGQPYCKRHKSAYERVRRDYDRWRQESKLTWKIS